MKVSRFCSSSNPLAKLSCILWSIPASSFASWLTPFQIADCTFAGRDSNGWLRSTLKWSCIPLRNSEISDGSSSFHGANPPPRMGLEGFGSTLLGSSSNLYPSPEHSEQAPKWLLNEKVRGSTAAIEIPQSTQASFSE